MLKNIIIILLCIFSFSSMAKNTDDEKLYIVHFEIGPSWNHSLEPKEQISFQEHSHNMNRLRKVNIIIFGARYTNVGIIIIKAQSLKLARTIIANDPGVKARIFDYRVEELNVFYPWNL